MSPGAWLRAGMSGAVVGVDIAAGLSRIDPLGLDLVAVRELAAAGEGMFDAAEGRLIGLVPGVARLAAESAPPDTRSNRKV